MLKKQNLGIAIVALVFGFFGGAVAHRLFSNDSVSAQSEPAEVHSSEIVKAQGFQLVDEEGKILGVWTRDEHGEPVMMLYDNQRLLWSAPPQARFRRMPLAAELSE